jgi:hypothetical protein
MERSERRVRRWSRNSLVEFGLDRKLGLPLNLAIVKDRMQVIIEL